MSVMSAFTINWIFLDLLLKFTHIYRQSQQVHNNFDKSARNPHKFVYFLEFLAFEGSKLLLPKFLESSTIVSIFKFLKYEEYPKYMLVVIVFQRM